MSFILCVNKEELTVSNSVFSSAFKPLLSSYRIVNCTFIFACQGIFYFHKGYFRGHQFLQVRGKGNSFAFDYLFISLSFPSHWFCNKSSNFFISLISYPIGSSTVWMAPEEKENSKWSKVSKTKYQNNCKLKKSFKS